MQKALFLDRDGVINEDDGYIHTIDKIIFQEGIFELCAKAQELGYLIIVVSNQSGVGKGLYSEEDVITLHIWLAAEFKRRGITIHEIYYSTYHPEATHPNYLKNPHHRKPAPGMIIKALDKYDIDINHSLMIGDKESDRIAYKGLHSYIIKSKYCPTGYDVEILKDVEKLLS